MEKPLKPKVPVRYSVANLQDIFSALINNIKFLLKCLLYVFLYAVYKVSLILSNESMILLLALFELSILCLYCLYFLE